jgi:[ribosomal protein S18]-alanine N-acetyltransferase
MEIRRAGAEDFAAIHALDQEAWNESPGGELIPDGSHVWRVWVERALVFCAVENGTVLGAVLAFPCIDGSIWLHKVFVSRDCRGRGVGGRLFDALFAEIDARRAVLRLTVDPANGAAVHLYEKKGFSEKELVPDYYGPGKDRYVMTRGARP